MSESWVTTVWSTPVYGGTHNGSGNATLSNIPAGTITLTWLAQAGYDAPASLQTAYLPRNGAVRFSGAYVRQTGTLGINPSLGQEGWQLTGPNSLSIQDLGTTTILHAPTGQYTITWLPLAGWSAPSPQVQLLGKDEITTLSGLYRDLTPPQGGLQINDGATWTSSTTVLLTLAATDAGSGVGQMRLTINPTLTVISAHGSPTPGSGSIVYTTGTLV